VCVRACVRACVQTLHSSLSSDGRVDELTLKMNELRGSSVECEALAASVDAVQQRRVDVIEQVSARHASVSERLSLCTQFSELHQKLINTLSTLCATVDIATKTLPAKDAVEKIEQVSVGPPTDNIDALMLLIVNVRLFLK